MQQRERLVHNLTGTLARCRATQAWQHPDVMLAAPCECSGEAVHVPSA